MSEEPTTKGSTEDAPSAPSPSGPGKAAAVARAMRLRIAAVVRLVFTLVALILALGALLVALRHDVNSGNPIVKGLTGLCDAVDGPFSRHNGIFRFTGPHAVTKDALVNWGIAALVYLVVGRILQRLIAPRTRS